MARHFACLTFDFDAVSTWIARGMTSPTPISRGEFGVVGVRRLLELLGKYSIRATFFIPGHTIETFAEPCREIVEAGHEVGHHGWTHLSPLNMSPEEEEKELKRGLDAVRGLTGQPPRGYRSPVWDHSPITVDLLVKYGFFYDSSMMADDYTPYRARSGDRIEVQTPMSFGRTTKLIEIPVSWSLDDAPHFELVRTPNWVQQGLMNAQGVLDNWVGDFEYMAEHAQWGALTYTCHPYCIGRGHRMRMLERLVQRLRELGATFESMGVVADEFDKLKPYKKPS